MNQFTHSVQDVRILRLYFPVGCIVRPTLRLLEAHCEGHTRYDAQGIWRQYDEVVRVYEYLIPIGRRNDKPVPIKEVLEQFMRDNPTEQAAMASITTESGWPRIITTTRKD